jgi:predicted PurR-regulated permease PerM
VEGETNDLLVAGNATIPPGLQESAQRGRMAWKRLWLRLRSVTPAGLVRTLLVAALLSLIVWLLARAGLSMLPFWVGLVLAYITLPFVNWLDRFIPRILAVVILLLLEVLLIGLVVAVLVPVLIEEIVQLVRAIPSLAEMQAWLLDLERYLKTLPAPMQDFLDGWLRNAYNMAKLNFTDTLLEFISASTLTAFSAVRWVTFLLSFLVIPTWLVSVLQDQRQVRRSLNGAMPALMRADFWAVIAIFDRTFNAYVTGRLIIATLVGLGVYAGLTLLPTVAAMGMPVPFALALIVATFNLVPVVGTILGVVPLALVGFSVSWELAATAALLYIVVLQLVHFFVAPRLHSRAVDIHPAVLGPIVVLGSTFGFLGAVLAGPLAVVTRDLFRYVYGRFEEPPRPAGVLPTKDRAQAAANLPKEPVPLRSARRIAADR